MKQIDITNFNEGTPDDLISLIGGNQGQIIEQSIAGLIEIGRYMAQAIANGPRIKRIRALEQYEEINKKITIKISEKLTEFEKRINDLETKLNK